MSTSDDFEIVEDGTDAARFVESALLRSLRQTSPQGKNVSVVLSAKAPKDTVIGGLTAGTSYGWLLIKTLWVAEEYRGGGVGRALVEEAETRGRSAACHGAWLDTSSADAMGFYGTLGYETFAKLENGDDQAPAGHCRWFMKKRL